MAFMLKTICLLLCFSLAATSPPDPPPPHENPISEEITAAEEKNYWKYHQWASVGYRRDRQKFHETGSTTEYTGRNTMELLFGSHLEWHKIVLYMRGSYGWLLNGDLDFSAPGNRYGEPLFFGEYDLGAGYTADLLGALGFRIQFYNQPNCTISFIPSGGYKYSHLMNFAEGENRYSIPSPPATLAAGTSGFALARFPNPNQQDWFGPFAEGRIEFLFWEQCEWSLYYQYHWPTVRSKSKEEVDLYLFNPPTTATAIDLFRSNSIYKASFMSKQLAGTDFRFISSTGWNFGAHFEGSSAWTDKARYHSKRTQEQSILAPIGVTTTGLNEPASIHWVCYEVSASLGYQF